MINAVKGARKSSFTHIPVFEYGLLCSGEDGSDADVKQRDNAKVTPVPKAAFQYLRQCCLCDESESRFLRLKSWCNMEVLQVQNYAGVVRCPDSTQIEILPKIAKSSSDKDEQKTDPQEQARGSLLMMLKTLKQFRHIQTDTASVKTQHMPLLEIFIAQFLASVNELIKKGIKSDYVQVQNNSAFLKGKLLASQQLRHNFVNRHKFYVEYDEYLPDRAENRLIHSALAKVASYTQLHRNQKLLQELLFAFADVPESQNHRQDFSGVCLQRGMQYYDAPLAWAKLILEGYSPQAMSGSSQAYSLLFPMETIFEGYVAHYLKKHLPASITLATQVQSEYLVKHGDKDYFRLKPDLHLHVGSKGPVILDTKWKRLNSAKSSGTDKFGLSQQDFYQMLGYGHNYLNGEGLMALIYPKTADFQEPLPHSFDYDDKLKLWVLPFDISPHCEYRIDLSNIGIQPGKI